MTGELACDADALALLQGRGHHVREIVRVDVDAILYINKMDRPHTAWVRRGTNLSMPVEIVVEPGFPAERGRAFAGER